MSGKRSRGRWFVLLILTGVGLGALLLSRWQPLARAGDTGEDPEKCIEEPGWDLYWETYDKPDAPDDNTLIDAHPDEPANGGKRIFPGKITYEDTYADERRLVFAVIEFTEEPPEGTTKMWFRLWDVDDPSASAGPIDEAGSPDPGTNGPDNRDSSWAMAGMDGSKMVLVELGKIKRFPGDGGPTECDAKICKVAVRVGMQPGDNWRFCAAREVNENALRGMTQNQADRVQPPGGVNESEMLTTWRKLHLECDTMQAVVAMGDEKNHVTGTADEYVHPYDGKDQTWIDLGQEFPDEMNDKDMYEGGTYYTLGGEAKKYTIISYEDVWWNDEMVVEDDCSDDSKSYLAVDDDDVANFPRRPLLDKIDKIFAACYIEHADDGGGEAGWSDRDTPFDRNLYDPDCGDRESGDAEADNWWVVYVLGAYQFDVDTDSDPDRIRPDGPGDGEECTFGTTHAPSRQRSFVFGETLRDRAAVAGATSDVVEAQTVVHEIGHQVLESGDHTPHTIMDETLPVPPEEEKFGPQDIANIRGKVSSPGE